jgi:hypothetical protein
MNEPQIWKISVSCEEDRPQIGDADYWNEWDELKASFPDRVDTLVCKQLVAFHADALDALDWDWYGGGVGTWGMWSQRAKELLWPYTQGSLRCFQTSLNGAPYYILRVDKDLAVDCLDVDRSDIQYFDDAKTEAWKVLEYAFRPNVIVDPLIFHAPQRSDILVTNSIRRIIEDSGLNGFAFYDAADLYGFWGKPRPSA